MHASCVAIDGNGVLIRGASGSGKSALALEIMARGGVLIADDTVFLTVKPGQIIAMAPATTAGLIEARGVGILRAEHLASAPISLVVDLDWTETHRLPQHQQTSLMGQSVALCHKVDSSYFAAALVQYLKGGRWDAE